MDSKIRRLPTLSQEPIGLVPLKRLPRRAEGRISRQAQRLAVQVVIMAPVLEIVFEPPADFKAPIGRDCHVADIEEPMNVGS